MSCDTPKVVSVDKRFFQCLTLANNITKQTFAHIIFSPLISIRIFPTIMLNWYEEDCLVVSGYLRRILGENDTNKGFAAKYAF